MNGVVAAALGAGAVLALVILGKDGGDRWRAVHGRLASLSELPAEGVVVPFQLIKDNPILPVLLEGDDHLTCWILDTGYGYTAVAKRLADRIRLRPTGTLSVQTLRTDDLKSTMVPSGYIFDMDTNEPVVEIPRHSAVIRKLPNTLENTHGPWSGSACLKPGGILGITFLRHFVTRLDYRKRTLTFYDPARFEYRGRGTKFTGWLEDEHYFLIPLEIDGVVANMALDTGAFANIMTQGFLDKYRRQTGHRFGGGAGEQTVQASFSEMVITLHKYKVGRAELANHLFTNLEVLYPRLEKGEKAPGLLGTRRFDGLMGYPILKNFVLYFVYEPEPYVIFE